MRAGRRRDRRDRRRSRHAGRRRRPDRHAPAPRRAGALHGRPRDAEADRPGEARPASAGLGQPVRGHPLVRHRNRRAFRRIFEVYLGDSPGSVPRSMNGTADDQPDRVARGSADGPGEGGVHHARPARPDRARTARRAARREVLGDLKLALTEACTNSVKHAYDDGGRDGRDHVRAVRRPARWSRWSTRAGGSSAGAVADGRRRARRRRARARRSSTRSRTSLAIRKRAGGGASLRFVKRLP